MSKVRYFYYNDEGEKRGGFSGKEIKALAKSGLIKPDTVIETEDGKKYKAVGIGGVEFGSEEKKESTPDAVDVKAIPVPSVANANTNVNQNSSVTTSDLVQSLYYYYNRIGDQRGPYTIENIMARALSGAITPDTVIELEGGRKYRAEEIGGIEFEKKSPTSTIQSESTSQDTEMLTLRMRLLELENKLHTAHSPSIQAVPSQIQMEEAAKRALADHRYKEALAHLGGCLITMLLPFFLLAMMVKGCN